MDFLPKKSENQPIIRIIPLKILIIEHILHLF